ncbi:MAG TPA: hypothetical protein VK395_21445 [Gemmataceae bacterium]|nr:hypothetical protein [Gemmataceae bacterium]
MRARLGGLLVGFALVMTLTGCGGGQPAGPPTADPQTVHGKIKFADGTELKGGIVYFTPLEIEGPHGWRYEAAGLVDAHGNYVIGFNNDKSGAPTGEYKVRIEPLDYNELKNANSKRIPQKYRSQGSTPLTRTVGEGDNTFDLVLD